VIWFVDLSDESAREIRTNLPAGSQPLFPSLSPDGNLVSFVSDNGQSGNLFVYDASDDVVYQYTFSGRHAGGSFSSDSKYLYYTKQVGDDEPAIYRRLVGESGQEESIAEGIFLPKVARDDSYILGTGLPPTYDFELLKITPSSLTVSELGQDTDGNNPISGMLADISPDGRYITYQSTDGLGFVATDLFVISADGQQKVQIPGVEGSNPVWSEDGRYIYYATYGNVFRLPVRTSPTFNILGEPEWVLTASSISGFDLHSDNNTLVVAASRIEFEQITGDADRVVWVQNWSGYLRDELRR
jgi:Tol biopolymer transport system component